MNRLDQQLGISMISQEKIWIIPVLFYFYVVFLKNQNISSSFLQMQTLLSVIQLVKTSLFPVQLINVKYVFNM